MSGERLRAVWATPAPGSLERDLAAFPAALSDPFEQMRALVDTSVLIAADDPGELEGVISAASLAELHFGVLMRSDEDERARRAQRLGVIEATFEPLAVDAAVAREWGRLAAAIRSRGGRPRRRAVDLAITATANVHGVPLLAYDSADLTIIRDLVDVRVPRALEHQKTLQGRR